MKGHKLSKRITLYIVLAGLFLTNAITAEIIGAKLFSLEALFGFDEASIHLFGQTLNLDLPAGFILWPVVFITTDIINEYYGKDGVRKISILTAAMISLVFLFLWITTELPPSIKWLERNNLDPDGNIFNYDFAIGKVFVQSIGIIIGSLIAFLIGQLLDASFFQWFRKMTGEKMIWLRATGSTFLSQMFDSYIVLMIAFYIIPKMIGQQSFTIQEVLGFATLGYTYKVVVAIILTPLIYLAHYIIDWYLGDELADKMMHEAEQSE